MKIKIIIAILSVSVILGFTYISKWNVDALRAKIKFDIDGPFGIVHGDFSGLKATILFNENDLDGSSITASIDAGTVNTGLSLRNRDLRKKEQWLNSSKYPRINFQSTKIEKTGKGYKAIGNLTIKETTHSVEIPFSFVNNSASGHFAGKFSILRMDYQLGKKGGTVGEVITIILEVPVNK